MPKKGYFLSILSFITWFATHTSLFGQATSKPNHVLSADSSVLDTKVLLSPKSRSLGKALNEISQRYAIHFSYVHERLPLGKAVASVARATPLRSVLETFLTGTDIVYFLLDDQIVLAPRPVSDALGIEPMERVPSYDSTAINPETLAHAAGPYRLLTIRLLSNRKLPKQKRFRTFIIQRRAPLHLTRQAGGLEPGLSGPLKRSTDTLATRKDTSGRVAEDSVRRATPVPAQRPVARATKKAEPKPEHRFVLSALFIPMPEFISWGLRVNTPEQANNLTLRNQYDSVNAGVSAGLSFHYLITKKLSVGLGLYYLYLAKNGKHRNTLIDEAPGGRETVETLPYTYNYGYLSMPLVVGYEVKSGKFSVTLNAGVAVNVWVGSNQPPQYPVYTDQYYNSTSPAPVLYYSEARQLIVRQDISFQRSIASLNFAVDLNLALSPRTRLFFSPSLKYFQHSIYNRTAPVSEKPLIVGFALGFKRYL